MVEVLSAAVREVEHGWVAGRPSPELVELALERQRYGDEAKPNTMRNVASIELRARGFIAEKFVAAWLREQGVEFVANGGPDALPDLELGGQRIGVRLCAIRASVWQPHHRIYVFDRHTATVDGWFFCGCEEMDGGRYLLLGGVTRERFLADAEPVSAGGWVCPGFRAAELVWVQRARILTPPREWLAGGVSVRPR